MKPPAFQRRSLLQELTLRGVRITRQRRILIETIQEADRHLDAASLLALARKRDRQINRATVYRTIELLKKLRLIDELDLMHLDGEKHFYEVRPNVDHVHLACFQCGRIEEYTSPLFERLKAEISRQKGFHIRVVRQGRQNDDGQLVSEADLSQTLTARAQLHPDSIGGSGPFASQ